MTETKPSPKSTSVLRGPWLVVIVLAIFLVITIGLLITTLNIRDQAQSGQATALAQVDAAALAKVQADSGAATTQARLAFSDSQRLGAQALLLSSNSLTAQLAALLSIRALGLGYSAEADVALSQNLAVLSGTPLRGNQMTVISDSSPIDHPVFSADGKQIIAHTGSQIKWWDVQTGAEMRSLNINGDVVMFSSDHKMVLLTTLDSGGMSWTAHLIQLDNDNELQHFTSPTKYMISTRLLAGDKYLITVGAVSADKLDPVMQLWNVQTGQEVKRFANGEFDAVLSPNGKYLITASKFGFEQLDMTSFTEIRKLPPDVADFTVFSPDSRFLLTGSEEESVTLWNADTGHSNGGISDGKAPADFSPDSNFFYINGKERLHVLDSKTETEHGSVDAATGVAAFSLDSTLLVAAANDNTTHVLSTQTGTEIRVLRGHDGPITDLAFSPDGQYLMTGSADGTVRLWKTDYHPLIAQVCRSLSRDLTDAERRKYAITDSGPTCRSAPGLLTF